MSKPWNDVINKPISLETVCKPWNDEICGGLFRWTFQLLCSYSVSSAFCWFLVCFQLIDNVPILQIDMVWCYFMLRDIRWLSVAGARLEKAREGIERAYGKDSSRVRFLQAGRHPELAMWVFTFTLLLWIFLAVAGRFPDMQSEAKFCKLLSIDIWDWSYWKGWWHITVVSLIDRWWHWHQHKKNISRWVEPYTQMLKRNGQTNQSECIILHFAPLGCCGLLEWTNTRYWSFEIFSTSAAFKRLLLAIFYGKRGSIVTIITNETNVQKFITSNRYILGLIWITIKLLLVHFFLLPCSFPSQLISSPFWNPIQVVYHISIPLCCWFQLQVHDEALSLVMSMGFKERDVKRALRMSNQDVGSAVDFLVEEKAKRAQKREEDIRRRTEIMWVWFDNWFGGLYFCVSGVDSHTTFAGNKNSMVWHPQRKLWILQHWINWSASGKHANQYFGVCSFKWLQISYVVLRHWYLMFYMQIL